ncbi:MAG: energy transducer TonB [Candidatus Rokuibacteriota bacterium]
MSRGFVASLVVHAVVVTALLTALPSSELLPALFVDLTAVDSGGERASPAPVPPTAARTRARRQPATSAPALPSSGPPAVTEAPALPEATSSPSRPSAPPLPPPMAASLEEPAVEPAPPAPARSVPPAAEPESPSASAALSDLGGRAAPPEPASAHPGGGSASDETPGWDAPASRVGLAVAPDQRSVRPSPGNAAGGGDRAGPELARRSPTREGDAGALYTEYLAGLRQRIHAALRYPPVARRRGLTGAVTIELTILPSGMIRDVSIVKSSAHRLLDEAAVETVRELGAQPFPASVPARILRVRLPIVFELQ